MENYIKISPSNSGVTLRAKFANRLEKLSKEVCNAIIHAIITFAYAKDNLECLDILWHMTYSPASGVKLLGLEIDPETLENFNEENHETLTAQHIPASLVLPLRNELRYQRCLVHENFLEPDIPAGCEVAYNTLQRATDIIVAEISYIACYMMAYSKPKEDVERALHLLASNKESYYFGGICSLKFDKYEAEYLKPFATLLHNLLKVIYDGVCSNCDTIAIPVTEADSLYQSIIVPESKTLKVECNRPMSALILLADENSIANVISSLQQALLLSNMFVEDISKTQRISDTQTLAIG